MLAFRNVILPCFPVGYVGASSSRALWLSSRGCIDGRTFWCTRRADGAPVRGKGFETVQSLRRACLLITSCNLEGAQLLDRTIIKTLGRGGIQRVVFIDLPRPRNSGVAPARRVRFSSRRKKCNGRTNAARPRQHRYMTRRPTMRRRQSPRCGCASLPADRARIPCHRRYGLLPLPCG